MKVIHSLAYNPGVTGNNPHDYQRFLVDEAAAEYWNITIQSVLITIPVAPGFVLPPPVATFDMAQYRARPGYSVPLSSQGVFLTGFGESPLDPNRQAQYTFTFGDGVPVIG
jgi:hypothetical protein